MGRILGGKGIFPLLTRFKLLRTQPFCSSQSSPQDNKPTTIKSSNNSTNGSSSLSNYEEQYKALSNLDFMSAAKILFTEPVDKKNFGLDFHLVQLFFVCLPSLAVYLVAQFARSEMRKMDAELELKKQAEFKVQAKEMEQKAAEERAAVASNPEIVEVKERLDKIEETVKLIFEESKKNLGDCQSSTTPNEGGKRNRIAAVTTNVSPDKQKDEKHGGTSGALKK